MTGALGRPSRTAVGLMVAALVAVVPVCLLTRQYSDWDLGILAVLTLSALLSELTAITLPSGKMGISAAFLALVLAMVLLGGAPAAVVGLLMIAATWPRWREPWHVLLSNLAAFAWFAIIAGLAFHVAIDGLHITPDDPVYYLLVFGTFVLALALNFCFVAGYQCYLERSSLIAKVREALLPILASELASALLAVATAFVYHELGLSSLALIGLVMLVFQYLLGELLLSQERAKELERRSEELQQLAVTDQLTGLGNRRKLIGDLEQALGVTPDGSDEQADRSSLERTVLVIYDLDGFKRWNDSYGHSGGDQLLRDLAKRLSAALGDSGDAYRLGGDEFCALIRRPEGDADEVVRAGAAALTETDAKVRITCCHGEIALPAEATDPIEALKVADARMYLRKDARPMSASGQVRTMLLRVLDEQQPELHDHSHDVSSLSRAVALALGMFEGDVDDTVRLAELHDVGKIAIPQSILRKPGPLDDEEWRVMRLHTIIGERMLGSTPALSPVARLVRASHERWDGGGYPDGLTADEIPLPARIVSACDAFDAMVTDRPYRQGMAIADAVEELERCAGTQFDPGVVGALVAEIKRLNPSSVPAREPARDGAGADAGPVTTR